MADNTLAGGGVGVGVYEAAELGIVVAGLEIIELGVSNSPCPIGPFIRRDATLHSIGMAAKNRMSSPRLEIMLHLTGGAVLPKIF